MMIRLQGSVAGVPGSMRQVTARYLSLVYKLDQTDPMNAGRARLAFVGGTDHISDWSGSTLIPGSEFVGAVEQVTRVQTITPGLKAHAIDGINFFDGHMLTYRGDVETSSRTVYPADRDGAFNYLAYTNSTRTKRTARVRYRGEEATMYAESVSTEDTLAGTSSASHSGVRANTWPYYMRQETVDGVERDVVYMGGEPNGSPTVKQLYRWAAGTSNPAEFVLDPSAAPLMSLPPRLTPYTDDEIGPREKGHDFIRYGMGAINRFGEGIQVDDILNPLWIIPGDILSSKHYIGTNDTDCTFQIKRIKDGVRFGSRMRLIDLPGITDRPWSRALAERLAPFGYDFPFDTTAQSAFSRVGLTGFVEGYIKFVHDVRHQLDPRKEWVPKTSPESPP